MFQHSLVPTDGSELSDQAVAKAVSLAKETGVRITFFFASPGAESSVYGEAALLRALDPQLLRQAIDARAQEVLARAQGTARAAGVTSEAVCAVSDEPYKAIIAAAEQHDCDLIVMASHGHRGIKGLLLGSQTMKVLTHSTIPVLVYR